MATNYVDRPLSANEEFRLSTLGNCFTMALFRPFDNRKELRSRNLLRLWKGYPLLAFNKVLDDEIFGTNLARVSDFAEAALDIKNPSKTPQGKAAVGILARCLTLTISVPYQQMLDKKIRREMLKTYPLRPLYRGFERQLIKESMFTGSYVLLSDYFGTVFTRRKDWIAEKIATTYPNLSKERQQRYTNLAIISMKAGAAGACASMISQPVEFYGRNVPVYKQLSIVLKKSVRKGCYNSMNALVVQWLYSKKIHRKLFAGFLAEETVYRDSK